MRILKELVLNEKIQCGLFGFVFLLFALKGLISGEMCWFAKHDCNPITFDADLANWIAALSICWGLAIYLLYLSLNDKLFVIIPNFISTLCTCNATR